MTPYWQSEHVALWCGDNRAVLPRLADNSVDLVVTSPPYNCRMPYDGGGDARPWEDYYTHMGVVLDQLYRVLVPGGTLGVNVPSVIRWQADHPHADTWNDFDPHYPTHRNGKNEVGRGRIEPIGFKFFQMMFERDRHLREPIVWVKGAAGGDEPIAANSKTGSDNNPYFRQTHEWILVGSKGQWYHRGGTGRRGRDVFPPETMDFLKDVWMFPGSRDQEHPAPFPKEIPHRLIRLFCHAPNCVVLDPFCGSGTTLEAARELGFRSIGIEISQRYCELAKNRLSQQLMEFTT